MMACVMWPSLGNKTSMYNFADYKSLSVIAKTVAELKDFTVRAYKTAANQLNALISLIAF